MKLFFSRSMAEHREDFLIWLSWKLPRELVKWCAIRVITERCEGNPGDRTAAEIMQRWGEAA